jgi:hypothetical protein
MPFAIWIPLQSNASQKQHEANEHPHFAKIQREFCDIFFIEVSILITAPTTPIFNKTIKLFGTNKFFFTRFFGPTPPPPPRARFGAPAIQPIKLLWPKGKIRRV